MQSTIFKKMRGGLPHLAPCDLLFMAISYAMHHAFSLQIFFAFSKEIEPNSEPKTITQKL